MGREISDQPVPVARNSELSASCFVPSEQSMSQPPQESRMSGIASLQVDMRGAGGNRPGDPIRNETLFDRDERSRSYVADYRTGSAYFDQSSGSAGRIDQSYGARQPAELSRSGLPQVTISADGRTLYFGVQPDQMREPASLGREFEQSSRRGQQRFGKDGSIVEPRDQGAVSEPNTHGGQRRRGQVQHRDASGQGQYEGSDSRSTTGGERQTRQRENRRADSHGEPRGPGELVPVKQLYDYFTEKGFTKAQAAGILGNMQTESSFRTNAYNASEQAIGLCQWENSRRTQLEQFAAQQGKPVTDWRVQVDFMMHEFNTTEKRAFAALKATQTPEQAAKAFQSKYERSAALTNRATNARTIYDQL